MRKDVLGVILVLVIVVAGVIGYYTFFKPKPTKIVWVSTQLNPPEEQAVIKELLEDFKRETGIEVEFVPISYSDLSIRLEAEMEAGNVSIDLIGELHGGLDYFNSKGWLMDLTDMPELSGRTFISTFENYATIDGKKVYIPWMSATYVMVINKDAFNYLPDGLTQDDIINGTENWTYDKFLEWAIKLETETGSEQVGFPAGPKGLFVRFLHGYLYPSYTGAQAKYFNSTDAVAMWNYLNQLWDYVHPSSTTWDAMAEPLLKGDVLVAWDHTARIKSAITEKPEDFVVVPVPRGPKGRGFILVVAGLAIPKNAPNPDAAWKLIEFLTRPEIQNSILENVGFFPTVVEASEKLPEGPLKILAEGVATQSATPDAVVAMIPNLGAKGGDFKDIYRTAWDRIVLKDEDPATVTTDLADDLWALFEEVGIEIP